jgi:putative membrane protein
MMGNWDGWGWGWGMGFGWIFMILFGALVIFGIVALAKWLFSASSDASSGKGPLEVLKQRYARGEITREQYEQMRRDIQS